MSEALPSVLVVEDDPELNSLVGAYVQLCGYEYRSALDGLVAVDEAQRRPPDAVILDLMLPGLDGFEVCRQLRQSPGTTSTPIIVLSALGDPNARARTTASGASEHLVKPFDPDRIMALLTTLMGGRATHPA